MSSKTILTLTCEICGNNVKLDVVQGQPVVSPSAQVELASWHSILRPDMTKLDYCSVSCLQAGASRLTLKLTTPYGAPTPETSADSTEKVDINKLREIASS